MKAEQYVKIKPIDNKINISWGYVTLFKREDSGMVSCYIPSFDIYFSAKDDSAIKNKSSALTHMFFDYFLSDRKTGLKALAIQLHKLGFVEKMHILKDLINKKRVSAKFNHSPIIPTQFINSEKVAYKLEMAL